jgi:ribonucleoside-diphosphate reductase alpha chain
MLTVTKRDGRIEKLDISKIQKYTKLATEGLENVSQSELEVDAKLQFVDKIRTSEIQNTLIKTAVDKIDIDRPNWTFVASKLFLYDLCHKVSGFNGYIHLKEYFNKAKDEGRLAYGFIEKYDLDDLNDYMDTSRDMQFTYLGIKTLHDRYLLKDKNGKPIELPQHMFMAIAMFLAQNEFNCQDWAKKFYDLISKFEVMLATPTLSNARTTRHQLSSCYVGSAPDNIEGIFDSFDEMSKMSKFGGGIGWDFSKIRALGSSIDNHKNASGGVIPFLKIVNDIAIAVDQLGTRKGAIAVYNEVWHLDIDEFLDLKKNSGEERRRTHDLFPALWICDLFMQRVEDDDLWTLFDPADTPDLNDCYGEEFEEKYKAYENNDNIRKKKTKAKDLWKKILKSYFETASPFLCFKDNANRCNPNNHSGIIRSSNLCTEIFQNTNPNHYQIKVTLTDENDNEIVKIYEEEELVKLDNGLSKKAKKITSIDKIDGKDVYIVEKNRIDGNSAVCNLASINLSIINTKEDIERVMPVVVRMLDNVIDLNYYPNRKTKDTNLKNRAIGLGVMGESEFLATSQIEWGSNNHLETIDNIMEMISYNVIQASSNLALEKGVYKEFAGSNWSKGILPIDLANQSAKQLTNKGELTGIDYIYNWDELRQKVQKDGMRNGYLMSVAPTSSISILVGTTQAIEPVYKRKWFEENLSGLIPVVVPNLNLDTFNFYKSAYDINQLDLIKVAAVRQKYIDQGQSLNIFMRLDKVSGKYLNDIYMTAWKLGLKSCYYLRSESPDAAADMEKVVDRSMECVGCQ